MGHLGTPELGGLALASQALLTFHAVMIFLAYGTTAAVSRLLGAGQEREAAHQVVQSMWIALAAGVGGAIGLYVFTDPILMLLGGTGDTLEHARTYLRVSLLGLPAMLIVLASVGYLRGLQDTVRPFIVAGITALGNLVLELVLIYRFDFGIGASALSTVIAQWVGAGMYLLWVGRSVLSHGVRLAPDFGAIRQQAGAARSLFIRTVALRGSFTVATAVAARIGEADLGAHEIVFQVWYTIALTLDAVAIAGQAMMGRFLGADDVHGARRVGNRMLQWGVSTGAAAAIMILVTRHWIPEIFSSDPDVVSMASALLLSMALMQPINGAVFALDGVLIGAGDMRFLAWAMVGAAALFIPLALLVPVLGGGLGWLWGSIWVLMLGRLAGLTWRFRGDAWLVTGATH